MQLNSSLRNKLHEDPKLPYHYKWPLYHYPWINWTDCPTNFDPYLIILETQLIIVIISTIQLTLN